MAIDNKYGRVTLERGTIGEDEPVVVFRAQDKLLPELLNAYQRLALQAGSPRQHLDAIDDAMDAVYVWQKDNHTQVPQSKGYGEGGDKEENSGEWGTNTEGSSKDY